jgi:hypothetical protein
VEEVDCRGTVSLLSLLSSKLAEEGLCASRGLIFLGVKTTKIQV